MMMAIEAQGVVTTLILLLWNIPGRDALAVVAKDGSGNFTNIMAAIAAAPDYSKTNNYIKIKAGIYNEYIVIEQPKTKIVLIGEGMDRTVITGNKSNGSGIPTYKSGTARIYGKGFVAIGITFENTAGPQMSQAVALLVEADNTAFHRCSFLGYQDTLYAKAGRQFYRDCDIQGTIDFIFGDATVIFQNCVIRVRKPIHGQSNTITAQGRDTENKKSGTVIQNCTIIAAPDLSQHELEFPTYLGRPWKRFSRTMVMQSRLGSLIHPRGWLEWPQQIPDRVYASEYENKGVGAETRGRVKWARHVTDPREAEGFTVRQFIQGHLWIPPDIPHYLDL